MKRLFSDTKQLEGIHREEKQINEALHLTRFPSWRTFSEGGTGKKTPIDHRSPTI